MGETAFLPSGTRNTGASGSALAVHRPRLRVGPPPTAGLHTLHRVGEGVEGSGKGPLTTHAHTPSL